MSALDADVLVIAAAGGEALVAVMAHAKRCAGPPREGSADHFPSGERAPHFSSGTSAIDCENVQR
jgi:hypothetical protein